MTIGVSPGRRVVMGGGRLSSHRKATGRGGSKAAVGRRRTSRVPTPQFGILDRCELLLHRPLKHEVRVHLDNMDLVRGWKSLPFA